MLKKNLEIFYVRGALYNVIILFFAGGLTQTFLLESGIGAQKVSLYVSVMQVAEVLAMVLLSARVERSRNLIRSYSIFHLFLLPMALAMLAVCFFPKMGPETSYVLMLAGGFVTYVAIGLVGILEYKLPYRILDMNEYGSCVAVQSIIIGGATLAVSALVSWAVKDRSFFPTIGWFLIPMTLMILICSRMSLKYREVDINSEMLSEPEKKINLLTYKPFYLLAVPNFLRGFATGTFNLFTTVGYHLGLIDTVTATYMVTIGNVVVFAVGLFYRSAAKLHKDTQILMASGILMLAAMPLAFLGGSVKLFLIVYAVAFFFKTIFEYVSPVSIVPILDYAVVGQYSAWRVALYLLGIALSGVLTIPMVDTLGVIPTMLINGLFFTLSGVTYYLVVKALLKQKQEKKENDD